MLGPSRTGRTCGMMISMCLIAMALSNRMGRQATATYMAKTKMQTRAT